MNKQMAQIYYLELILRADTLNILCLEKHSSINEFNNFLRFAAQIFCYSTEA
jgi:hypothetical protein